MAIIAVFAKRLSSDESQPASIVPAAAVSIYIFAACRDYQ